eukprot:CAMPEP_0175331662 /NCGR_PEP_ID=MMETSP0095-20121207/1361_1 /TAXON_ID=311494 /ORGANISM="Alexandrium monilatum, Strain CCMP3105" /LENGTH=71 /DNA_ID=CAMNT_0016628893 /DNA_START=212 /DNA_END=427 /DNA_ORIENTATION=-
MASAAASGQSRTSALCLGGHLRRTDPETTHGHALAMLRLRAEGCPPESQAWAAARKHHEEGRACSGEEESR